MEITELLTNPLVWGLLAWLFSRFFTSNKKEEETPKKQPNRQENHQNSRPNPRPNPRPVMTTGEQKPRSGKKPTLQTVQQAYENMKVRAEGQIETIEIVKEQPKRTQLVVKEEQAPKVDRNVNQNHLMVNRQNAVQGVVWSEILGAPRSKNPHYTRNRRHS
jgi:5'-3' exonuclease